MAKMPDADELLVENVDLLRQNVDLQKENLMLRKLLAEWRTLPGEPHPGEGLVSTSDVIDEHDIWNTIYLDLAARTDAVLARKA